MNSPIQHFGYNIPQYTVPQNKSPKINVINYETQLQANQRKKGKTHFYTPKSKIIFGALSCGFITNLISNFPGKRVLRTVIQARLHVAFFYALQFLIVGSSKASAFISDQHWSF